MHRKCIPCFWCFLHCKRQIVKNNQQKGALYASRGKSRLFSPILAENRRETPRTAEKSRGVCFYLFFLLVFLLFFLFLLFFVYKKHSKKHSKKHYKKHSKKHHKKHYKKQKKQTGGFRGSQKISPLATPLYQSQGISRRFSAILGFAEKHRETPRIGLYYRKGYIKAMGRCFYGFF